MRPIVLFLVLLSCATATPLEAQEDYSLPSYTDAQRWTRSATLQLAVLVGQLGAQKAAGLTAMEAGRASARTFGPPNGWNGSDTPMRLFRGMYRNWMSHPEQRCELVEAGEDLLRARCNRPYLSYFGDDGMAFGVSLREYEESGLGFASGLAEAHGMEWLQESEGDEVVITIRKP
ncbi:MAG: hypothetical protein ACR2QM_15460 [Longimicrobiales bacterium]